MIIPSKPRKKIRMMECPNCGADAYLCDVVVGVTTGGQKLGETLVKCRSGCSVDKMMAAMDDILPKEEPGWLLNAKVDKNITGYKSLYGRVPDTFFLDVIKAAISEGKTITQEDRENVLKVI